MSDPPSKGSTGTDASEVAEEPERPAPGRPLTPHEARFQAVLARETQAEEAEAAVAGGGAAGGGAGAGLVGAGGARSSGGALPPPPVEPVTHAMLAGAKDDTLPLSGFSSWTIVVLVIAHVVIVAVFAGTYWRVVKSLPPVVDEGVFFIAATVVWFAFCGLLSTILAKVTLSLLAEARLAQSRRYIADRIAMLLKLGVEREVLVRLIEHGVYREGSSEAVDAKAFAPVVQGLQLVKDMAETLSKKKE